MFNGVLFSPEQPALHIDDRGLLYGDGLFETMLLTNGSVRFLEDHLQRLRRGCDQLKIAVPDVATLHSELQQLKLNRHDGIIKLIITRGRGGRGYRASGNQSGQFQPSRLWQLFSPPNSTGDAISARWCETRLSRNSLLAGIKHLNRLEQVMAQSEWTDATINEGLMLDTENELVCGTMSNIFVVIDNALVTPDLRFCGVKGVMRRYVLRMARELGVNVEERPVHAEELAEATEVFVTNAIRGIQPLVKLVSPAAATMTWPPGEIASRLKTCLNEIR